MKTIQGDECFETLDLKQNPFDFSSKDISDYFFKLNYKI